jgi:hypothetical protein
MPAGTGGRLPAVPFRFDHNLRRMIREANHSAKGGGVWFSAWLEAMPSRGIPLCASRRHLSCWIYSSSVQRSWPDRVVL